MLNKHWEYLFCIQHKCAWTREEHFQWKRSRSATSEAFPNDFKIPILHSHSPTDTLSYIAE